MPGSEMLKVNGKTKEARSTLLWLFPQLEFQTQDRIHNGSRLLARHQGSAEHETEQHSGQAHKTFVSNKTEFETMRLQSISKKYPGSKQWKDQFLGCHR